MDDPRVEFCNNLEEAILEVHVRGRWDRRLRVALFHGLSKSLAQCPRAVIVNLSGLDDPAGRCLTTILAAHHAGAGASPPVPFVVCGATAGLADCFARVGLGRIMSVHDDLHDARRALRDRMPTSTARHLHLSPNEISVALARDMVGQACSDWQLGHLLHPTRLVVSELAQNAVEHARTPFLVALSLRGRLLHVAVRDESGERPRLLRPGPYQTAPLGDRGRGLTLVRDHCTAWGCTPCRDGKVVWATLRTQSG